MFTTGIDDSDLHLDVWIDTPDFEYGYVAAAPCSVSKLNIANF